MTALYIIAGLIVILFCVLVVSALLSLALRVGELEARIEEIYSMTHGDGR